MVGEFEGLIEKEVVKFDEVSREEAVLGFIIDVEVVGTELVELLVPGVVVEGVMAGKMLFNLFRLRKGLCCWYIYCWSWWIQTCCQYFF